MTGSSSPITVPWLAGRLDKRGELIVLFVLMIVGTVGAYGFAYADNNIGAFFGSTPPRSVSRRGTVPAGDDHDHEHP